MIGIPNSPDAPRTREVYDQLAGVGKALASGRRLELLELIAQGEQSVEVLARESGMGVTTVSSHLQILRTAGLVRTRRQQTRIFYRLADREVATLMVLMKRVGQDLIPQLRAAVAEHTSGGATTGEEVPIADLAQMVEPGVFMLDVRPAHEFHAGHYPGAVSIPLDELEERISEIPNERRVIVYCRGEFCLKARDAARMLRRARGIDAWAMDEGVLEWRADGQACLDASA